MSSPHLKALVSILVVALAAGAGQASEATFLADVKTLTAGGHRLAGMEEGSLAAGKYVEKLREIGVDEVYEQHVTVVLPVSTQCELIADGTSHKIFTMRPNSVQGSVTPAEGITGRTLYAGSGDAADYANVLPKDRIVVLDFDCGLNWLNAFAFGARAVLFVGGEEIAANAYHHLNMPANLPRFHVPAGVAQELKLTETPREVTLKAACEWREVAARNVIGVLRGTAPTFAEGDAPQAVVLAAALDSLSEVPETSPAPATPPMAALLQIAGYLKDNRPRRDVILAFFDAQAQNHLGARAFYAALNRRMTNKDVAETTIEQRIEMIRAEREYRRQILDILDTIAALEKFWKPYGELYSQKAALLDRKAYLKKRRDALTAERNRLAQADYPIEDLLADTEKALAEAEARSDETDAEINARLPELNARMSELQTEMDAPQWKKHDLFSEPVENMPRHDSTIRFLREEANGFDSSVLDELRSQRVRLKEFQTELRDLRKRDGKYRKDLAESGKPVTDDPVVGSNRQLLRGLQQQADELIVAVQELNRRDLGWNAIIRDLFKGGIRDQTYGWFARLVEQAHGLLHRRMAELDALEARAGEDRALRDAVGPQRDAIMLHVSVNLGDARTDWTFIHGDDTAPIPPDGDRVAGNYNTIFKTMREVFEADAGRFADFDGRAVSSIYQSQNRLFAPGLFVDSGAIARIFAIYNVAAMTSLDRLPRQGLPCDTLAALSPHAIFAEQRNSPFLKRLADHEGINQSPKIRPEAWLNEQAYADGRFSGPAVKQAAAGMGVVTLGPGPLVAIGRTDATGPWKAAEIAKNPPGFVFPIVVKTDSSGIFEVPAISEKTNAGQLLVAATFDRPDDAQPADGGAVGRGLINAIVNSLTLSGTFNLKTTAPELFDTQCITFVGYGFNRGSVGTQSLRARGTSTFQADRSLLCESESVLSVFAPRDAKGIKLFNPGGLVLLNNAPTEDEYQGEGMPLDDPFEHPVTTPVTARDLGVLNRYRLRTLRDTKIVQESLEILAGKALDLHNLAESRRPQGETGTVELATTLERYMGDHAASAALSRNVYSPLVGVMNDLVTAVVLLLLLAMPFAFALERLLIGSPHIYRQIGWFALFFMLTFGVLYFVNPAFRIAATPAIIFLAFTIILLSTLVIFIMVRKLQTEIRKLQGLAATVHSADVSRLNTMMAAVNMGISTMRRRPVRTLLTAVTVVLLTFTILTFASFGNSWGIRQTYEGPMTGRPARVLAHHQLWSPVDEGICEMLRGHLAGEAVVVPTYWISPTAQEVLSEGTTDMLLASEDLQHVTPVAAAVGLDATDPQRQPQLREMLGGADATAAGLELLARDGIFLTDAVRAELALDEKDIGKAKVLLAGQAFTYAGTIDDRLATFTLLDNSKALPVDYQASSGESADALKKQTQTQSKELSEMADMESAQFVNYNVDRVAIIPAHIAKIMRGRVRYITVYPVNEEAIQEIAHRVAEISQLPTYVGDRNGVQRMIFSSLAEASGVRDLLIPVVLGGLIIFATMLGSVTDRDREIYTFSSLGLAPAHVASLFFAEASVYAVVGGMGGYLLGQIVARVLGYFASLGWVGATNMNYSSTNAIVTILIVMSTVLISTIYPAVKASRSANPGIQRAWRIPKPDGNLYDLKFPFTVSAYDIVGVVSFLKEHFDNYADTSLGVFMSMEDRVFRQKENDMLGFRATVALAPFDLGVTQNFAMLSQPSDIEGINEVRILIHRFSGAHGDWQRSNRVFVHELRKQLLIWRSLPQEVMDRYREKTLATRDSLPVEQVTPESIGGSE